MQSAPCLARLLVAGALLASSSACGTPTKLAESEPIPDSPPGALHGLPGIGDPYFPTAGNGGYDVQHYDVVLDVDVEGNSVAAQVTIDAIATQDLSAFNLDLFGLEVQEVRVGGVKSSFEHLAGELTITTGILIQTASAFRVVVDYSGTPVPVADASVASMGLPGTGWFHTESGVYVISECIGAAGWLPCNNHPADKATFAFHVTVPEKYTVAANGILTAESRGDGKRTFDWLASDPMATYLATICIAEFEVRVEEGPWGLPLRLYYPTDATEDELEPFARTAEMLEYFATRFGPYPLEAFGGVLSYESIGGALETQTIPVYSRRSSEGTVVHELSHMWFGDSVTPSLWKDMWLNEGFATYAGWMWAEHDGGAEALEARVKRSYRRARSAGIRSPADPGVDQVFSGRTYVRGALALHAIREELGDELFFQVLTAWASEKRGGNGNTQEFQAVAERTSGRDLESLFAEWVHGDVLPDVPEYAMNEDKKTK